MKLYRGYQDRPKFVTTKLIEEYEVLKQAKERCAHEPGDFVDFVHRMGQRQFSRYVELNKIVGPQFFTDDKEIAKGFAGENGYLVVLDLDDDTAREHFRGDQMMLRDHREAARPVSNFVFSGIELGEHVDDWQLDLVELEREKVKAEGERSAPSGAEPTRSPFETIHSSNELCEDTRKALERFRAESHRVTPEGKKPPVPPEGESTRI